MVAKFQTKSKDPAFDAQGKARQIMKLITAFEPTATFYNAAAESTDEASIGTTTEEFQQYVSYRTQALNKQNTRHLLYISARLSKPFHQVKTLECIAELAKMEVYLESHLHRSEDHVNIGWLADIHPAITWKNQLVSDVHAAILSITGQQQIPEFDIIRRPKRFGNEQVVETNVYEFECPKQHEAFFTEALACDGFTTLTGATLVPARLSSKRGGISYSEALGAHTIHCNELWTTAIFDLKPQLLHYWSAVKKTKPVYNSLINMSSDIRLHETATSQEAGRFLLSYPEDKKEEAMSRIQTTMALIASMDLPTTNPSLLFDGRIPNLEGPQRRFTSSKLDNLANSICSKFRNRVSAHGTPKVIVLQKGRRYQGQASPSYQSVLNNDNASQQSAVSNATGATGETSVSKLTFDTEMRSVQDSISTMRSEFQHALQTQAAASEQALNTRLNLFQTSMMQAMRECLGAPPQNPAPPSGASTHDGDDADPMVGAND
jgi:hypothetical protein